MIRTAATYENLAPSIIADLNTLDRDSLAYRDALETLSVLSSILDSEEMGAPLAPTGKVTYIASTGSTISRHGDEGGARRLLKLHMENYGRAPYGGIALVKADRTGPVDVYTAIEL